MLISLFLGQRAREADRERVRQMRDQLRQNTAGEESGTQRGRGDPDFLPQVYNLQSLSSIYDCHDEFCKRSFYFIFF